MGRIAAAPGPHSDRGGWWWLLATAPTIVIVAYPLGRLKALYYYRAFGVDLGLLDLSTLDYLFESWFVLQNVLFFGLLWWTALVTRRLWIAAFGILHTLLPIASHYAFAFAGSAVADALIQYRHTLLKFVPLGVVAVVWAFDRRARPALLRGQWPHGRGAAALFGLILLAWGLSTAKHVGSFDAQQALRRPDRHLSRVERVRPEAGANAGALLYLIHADRRQVVVWDASGFVYGRSRRIHIVTLPRELVREIELSAAFAIQPGSQFL